jgi:hypothetical protein
MIKNSIIFGVIGIFIALIIGVTLSNLGCYYVTECGFWHMLKTNSGINGNLRLQIIAVVIVVFSFGLVIDLIKYYFKKNNKNNSYL